MPSKKLARAGVSKERFDRCVEKVQARGGVRNAFAVCESQFQKSLGLRRGKKGK